eukprot:CAMPEP_0202053026 /NCGR_PEP_ID=MMETSP0963-20130614/5614_1 /ASSEMBLY_ACC=CAM_ASM_000494 /TAXON_ID=4773 /ORGANISM="Schizochytrium aggregatum, Strain ATCC28209" /LENGTH=218 /DNA_ID=CAMNT_0048618333 /DNA_START=1109 /DNA_END=1768 /DNA_ORIENTATION=-
MLQSTQDKGQREALGLLRGGSPSVSRYRFLEPLPQLAQGAACPLGAQTPRNPSAAPRQAFAQSGLPRFLQWSEAGHEKVAHELSNACLAPLRIHKVQHVIGEPVDDRSSEQIIRMVEYEFSFLTEDPRARTPGEAKCFARVEAWHVSTAKKISLYRPLSRICSNAPAMSCEDISSESWNLRNSSPPWPVMKMKMLLPSFVSSRFEAAFQEDAGRAARA